MERVRIKVNRRDKSGKEIAKKLRKNGCIPAVVYSGDTNISLSIPSASMKLLRSIHFSESTVIDMEITEDKKHISIPVLIKDVQFNPLTEKVSHIDFLKVSLKEKIKVYIPIVLKGEPKEVKEGAGVLEQILRELEVEGLPLDIPEKIEVDISELEIGDSLHVENLAVPDKLKVISDPQTTVATIVVKKEEPEEELVSEEEAGVPEPEVIKEKKEVVEEEVKEEKDKREKPRK